MFCSLIHNSFVELWHKIIQEGSFITTRILPEFGYLRPGRVEEVTCALAEYSEQASILAGGTDLLVRMKSCLKPREKGRVVDH